MSDWKYEINDGLVAFYENGIERSIDKVFDVLNAAESRIAELEAERRWIPVSERLPEMKDNLKYYDVIIEGENYADIAFWNGWQKGWNFDGYSDGYSPTVTHWRERPPVGVDNQAV
jgi:hypothetical protein